MFMSDDGIKKLYVIEMPYTEREAILPGIIKAYEESTNIKQMAALKRLLQCLGCTVNDWTPLPERL